MNLIVAADKNWAIGKNQKLIWSIPADKKFFREKTMGHVVVMGRKTLESLPNGLPLDGRINIVMTSNPGYRVKGAVVVYNLEELQAELKKYTSSDAKRPPAPSGAGIAGCPDGDASSEVFVIGGESIYRLLLPYCDTAYVTKIDHAYEADAWFPDLDQMPEWKMVEESEEQTCFDLEYYFTRYEKQNDIRK